jgi:hypothetical protein
VADVYPALQYLTVQNRAKISGALNLTLGGPNAGLFQVGSAPARLGALEQVDLPIWFTPTSNFPVSATLTIDDGAPGTANPTVTLSGSVLALPAQPTLQTGPQRPDGSGFFVCEDGATLEQCTLAYPDTRYGQSATMELKLRNLGCPTLKITGLSIASNRGDTQGFSLDTPAQLPSPGAPLLLSVADGSQELTVVVRFTPTDDDSGNTERLAWLELHSNDPVTGDASASPARIGLIGQGVKPSLSASPAACDFTNASDPCGSPAPLAVHTTAQFQVANDGNAALQISRVSFGSSNGGTSTGGRFRLTRDLTGQTLAPAQVATVEVTYTDAPSFVSDTLEVRASAAGAPVGAASLQVSGGKKPCLITDPLDALDFGNPYGELTTKTIALQNGAGCGTLTLSQVSVDASPFFSLQPPLVAANTQVLPGASVTATVQFKRPVSGGMQLGALRILSDDAQYPAPQGKVVQLYSAAPLDKVPVAFLTACTPLQLGGDPACATSLSAGFSTPLSGLSPAQLTFSGVTSTDDGAVKKYRFTLLPPFPPNVTSAALANHATIITADTTVLSIPPGATGVYRVGLEVWDDAGQRSVNAATMSVTIVP